MIGSVVEVLGHVMGGRTDEFDAALLGPPIRRGADEGGQERVVDVDHRTTHLGEELRREDLHVPGQHHQIDVAAQQLELALLGLDPNILGRRHVKERHRERADLIGEIGMVGDHHHDRHVELTATIAPQQVEQAVIFLGRHDRDAFGFRSLGQPEVHVELRSHLLSEITFECVAGGRQPGKVKYRALHEGATRSARWRADPATRCSRPRPRGMR